MLDGILCIYLEIIYGAVYSNSRYYNKMNNKVILGKCPKCIKSGEKGIKETFWGVESGWHAKPLSSVTR